MSPLFDNAVSAIRMGIEDYAIDRPERSLSAVRNVYAGVLLLAKEVLARAAPGADPDEIIGARYKPIPDGNGGVKHVLDGHATVDFETLGKRFKDFGLEIDRSALRDLNTIRNEIEHRFTDKSMQVVREAIAKAFPVTLQLFRLAAEDPRMVLGNAWPQMLEARTLYQAELTRCRATLAKVKWHSRTVASEHLRCRECESDLIEQRDPENTGQEALVLTCQACGDEPVWDEAVTEAVERALDADAYIRAKETGESGPIFECPDCARPTYLEGENMCAACGYTLDWENCARCHASIPLAEALDGFDGGLCSYCTNLFDKD